MASKIPTVFKGDTIVGTFQLRLKDQINSDLENYYPLPASYKIEAKLPGAVASTDNVGEITVIDSAKSTISAKWSAAKTASCTEGQAAVDVIVTDLTATPNEPKTFEKLAVMLIKAREN